MEVTPLPGYSGPHRHPLLFDPLPGVSGYTAYFATADFAAGREGLLQLCVTSLSPCCRFHPAGVTYRLSQITVRHALFALALRARPPEQCFGATSVFVSLRPGDSQPSRRWPYRWASGIRFRSSLPSRYKALALTLAGLAPAERVRLRYSSSDSILNPLS